MTSEFEILRFEDGKAQYVRDVAVCERQFAIVVNGEHFLSVMATPKQLSDLAVGLLYGEGIIQDPDEITGIEVNETHIAVTTISQTPASPSQRVRLSGFGMGMATEQLMQSDLRNVKDISLRISPSHIETLMREFHAQSRLFHETGAVHSCCACWGGLRIFAEDVGRHNALDKVIGQMLKQRLNGEGAVLLTTGRVSTEILLKTAKAGICTLISRSAPTDSAILLARDLGMTMLGFVRGSRFNIYAGEERIGF